MLPLIEKIFDSQSKVESKRVAAAMQHAAFIKQQTVLTRLPFIPEMQLYLATEITPMWQASEEWLKQNNTSPPFWAFAWPGGQAQARLILDNKSGFENKVVMDFACGSGVASVAAAKMGAAKVIAVDIDPMAECAVLLNAEVNDVTVHLGSQIDFAVVPRGVQVIMAGDVCYEQLLATKILRWLHLCREAGVEIYIADPGRAYLPKEGLQIVAEYTVPTSKELEDRDSRDVRICRLIEIPDQELER